MTHPLQSLLDDVHIEGTETLINTLTHVVGKYKETPITTLLATYTDLYLLGGVQPFTGSMPYARHTKDADIVQKKYVVFDFDIRKEHTTMTDDQIKEQASAYATALKIHPFLKGWRYISYSGNGFHVWYISDTAYPCIPHMWSLGYKEALLSFAQFPIIQPDPACSNASRIIRLPYSTNTKNGEKKLTSIVETNDDWNSDMLKFIALFNMRLEGTAVKDMVEKIKREPISLILSSFGYQINAKNQILLNGKVSSCTIHPEKNYVHRFSGKPGSGDAISFLKGIEGLTFLEAVQKIAQDYFHETVAPTEKELVKQRHEDKKRQVQKKLESSYIPIIWNTPLMNAQFPPIKRYCYTVMAGETKSGKSTVAFDLAVKNAERGRNVLYITLEMTAQQLIENIARSAADVTPTQEHARLRKGKYEETQEQIFQDTVHRIRSLKTLYILGREVGSTDTIENIISTILTYDDLDLVIIDNLDKVDNLEGQNDFDKQKDVSNKLLHFTNDFCIPVILVHHLRKSIDEKRAMFRNVDALSGTGKISHDANIVVMVSREKDETGMYTSSSTFIRVAETREFNPAIRKVWFHDGTFYDENPVRSVSFDITESSSYKVDD